MFCIQFCEKYRQLHIRRNIIILYSYTSDYNDNYGVI